MNLLITGAWTEAGEHIETFQKLGYKVYFMQYEADELPCEYEWVEGVICNGLFLSHPIEKFVNLKYIQLTSVGYDRIPIEYIQKHQIEIHNAKGVYSIPMAEFALCGVLQIYKQSHFFYDNQKVHKWEKHRELLEISGKQVCIIGCGSVGTECAKRFSAFGCSVIGIELYPRRDIYYQHIYGLEKIDDILLSSDIVVLTLPLTESTRHLINKERIRAMKSDVVLVNIGRGGLLDIEALKQKLPEMRGAVLDVFENEPLTVDDDLWEMDNVILTPHNSFIGDGNRERLRQVICKNLQKFKI